MSACQPRSLSPPRSLGLSRAHPQRVVVVVPEDGEGIFCSVSASGELRRSLRSLYQQDLFVSLH